MSDTGTAKNTDRELWCEPGDWGDSIHVTENGGIGIECGGLVHVRPLREWHALVPNAEQVGPSELVEAVAQAIYEAIVEGPWPGPWAVWATTLEKPTFLDAARAAIAVISKAPRIRDDLPKSTVT